jgi:hypothetical protein
VNDGEPAETMTDKEEILAAIAAGNAALREHIDESVNALAGITKTSFERVEAGIGELKTAMDQIQTRLDRHETRLEALEARP